MKNGAQKSHCKGKKISVRINGIEKGSENEEVNCEVGKIESVPKGSEAEWSSIKGNLGTCLDVVFDVSAGNEPKIQVMTEERDSYCPKSVDLKINNMHFCGKTNKKIKAKGFYGKHDNSKIHDTIRGQC